MFGMRSSRMRCYSIQEFTLSIEHEMISRNGKHSGFYTMKTFAFETRYIMLFHGNCSTRNIGITQREKIRRYAKLFLDCTLIWLMKFYETRSEFHDITAGKWSVFLHPLHRDGKLQPDNFAMGKEMVAMIIMRLWIDEKGIVLSET